MKEIPLGTVVGTRLSARPSALGGVALVFVLAAGFAWLALRQPFGTAVVGALMVVVVHWLSDLVHQLGHITAARRTGYPAIGIQFWGVFSATVYPADEPPLPGTVHVRRALGGVPASLALAMVAGILALALRSVAGPFEWVLIFAFLDNLLVLGLGALLPLGFTDGSTLLRWWPKRNER
ncbi:MAG: hypothetical protein OJF49_004450 [Ktedonobacterales bacterium]|jgi:Zn-dependent protease|nr:MAG: hypothetical protein OJF49_004450 [Ktedonobacterales bacterium]